MAMHEMALKGYYRQVRGCLPCGRTQKSRIMEKFRASVDAWLEENPGADPEQVRAHFGSPREIALSYVEDMSSGELLNAMGIRRKIVSMVAGVGLAVVLIWGIAAGLALADAMINSGGTIEVSLGPEMEHTAEQE